MVTQYPYDLYLKTISSTKDNDGNFTSIENFVFVSKCRDEPQNKGKVNTEDSVEYKSNSVIFLPRNSPLMLKEGDFIEVRFKGVVRLSGELKGIYSGQLNKRVWL